MAEAPTPMGQDGDGTGVAGAAGAEPEPPKTYTQQQVEAMVAARLRNQKKVEAELRAQLADQERKLASASDDDEEREPYPRPDGGTGVTAPATAEDRNRWKRKFESKLADFEVERHELLARLEAADRAHNQTRIQHALMAELSKRGAAVRDIPSVMELTVKDFDVSEGQVVPRGDDVTTVAEYYDKWLAAHPVFVVGPPAGGGERVGRLPGAPKKGLGEMTEAEAHREATRAIFGAKK